MTDDNLAALPTPKVTDQTTLHVVGLKTRFHQNAKASISDQWKNFYPWLGKVPGQIDTVTYGISCNYAADGSFDYLCAVAVEIITHLPPELSSLTISPQRYAVFTHNGPLHNLGHTWAGIMRYDFSAAQLQTIPAPCFERYDERFDSVTGTGIIEIWIPVVNLQ